MKYMGSKRRIAKEILPIILQDRQPDQYYVEPFCGGCNTLEHVSGNRIGSDINPWLTDMWRAVSGGWMPPTYPITEDMYHAINRNQDMYQPALVGYVSFALSYGGKFWGGYARDKAGKRNYSLEAYRNALVQFPKLLGGLFCCSSYEDLFLPEESIIYCDPPYFGTTSYKSDHFDSVKFWNWCKAKADQGHTVYVSEYNCPIPNLAGVVFKKEQTSTLVQDTGSKRAIEKLFKIL
jgi:DNA adenine methylase